MEELINMVEKYILNEFDLPIKVYRYIKERVGVKDV